MYELPAANANSFSTSVLSVVFLVVTLLVELLILSGECRCGFSVTKQIIANVMNHREIVPFRLANELNQWLAPQLQINGRSLAKQADGREGRSLGDTKSGGLRSADASC